MFVERQQTLEIGTCSAILNFNSGINGIRSVLQDIGISPGCFTVSFGLKKDNIRVQHMDLKTSISGKQRRKKLHNIKKGFIDTHTEKEGVTSLCYCDFGVLGLL